MLEDNFKAKWNLENDKVWAITLTHSKKSAIFTLPKDLNLTMSEFSLAKTLHTIPSLGQLKLTEKQSQMMTTLLEYVQPHQQKHLRI